MGRRGKGEGKGRGRGGKGEGKGRGRGGKGEGKGRGRGGKGEGKGRGRGGEGKGRGRGGEGEGKEQLSKISFDAVWTTTISEHMSTLPIWVTVSKTRIRCIQLSKKMIRIFPPPSLQPCSSQ